MSERTLSWQETADELVASGRWRAQRWVAPTSRLLVAVGVLGLVLGSAAEDLPAWGAAGPLFLVVIGAALAMQTSERVLRAAVPEGSTRVLLRVGPSGLVRERGPVVERVPWAAVPRVGRTSDHLVLQIGRSAWAIPSSAAELDELAAAVDGWRASAQPPQALPAGTLSWSWTPGFERTLFALRAPQLQGLGLGAALFAAVCGAGLGATTGLSIAGGLGLPTDLPFVAGGLFGAVAGAILGLPGAMARLLHRVAPPWTDRLGVRLGDAGLEVWTDAGHATFAWSMVGESERRAGHVLLLSTRGAVIFAVPEHVLSDPEAFVTELRGRLASV